MYIEGSFVYIQKLQIQKSFTIFDDIQSSLLKKRLSQSGFTCPKLRMKTLEQGVNMFKVNTKDTRWRRSGVFIVNFEDLLHLILVLILLTVNM